MYARPELAPPPKGPLAPVWEAIGRFFSRIGQALDRLFGGVASESPVQTAKVVLGAAVAIAFSLRKHALSPRRPSELPPDHLVNR